VIFYSGDYVRQLEDVQRGNLDVAVVTSGFLEESYPDLVHSGALRFHLLTTPVFQDEPYPFLTSTHVVPGYGLAASEHIPPLLRERVYTALSRLNASHPLSAAASIAGFVAHASYELPRTVAIKVSSRQKQAARSIQSGSVL
jgi:ABC-type phosphate/phosphonate transport system substrate-binding protein